MLQKAKSSYKNWFALYNNFPKSHRYTLGAKVEDSFLTLLEHIFFALYLPIEKKITRLEYAIAKLDGLKFFLQISFEDKCISEKQYVEISKELDEVGRMLGGWKKGLETKISQQKTPAQ